MDAGLPRSARVRIRADFDRVFSDGRRNAEPLMSLHWLRSDTPARLGLAVSRKVDPHAVGRNRIKRVLRAEFRKLRLQMANGDYVLVARPAARTCEADALRMSFASLLRRAGALPPAMPGGTMPAASCPPGDTPPSR
ncbi:MAG TPA: ribonuclease P protein component [Lysobacter sp.]|nr:ribonuclease P protein component [Lysobacter sp.]